MLRIQPPSLSVTDRLHGVVDRAVKPPVRWTLGHGLPRVVIGRAARRGDLQGRLIETARRSGDLADLLPIFNEARAAGPLARGRLSAVSCSHPAVKEVLSDSSFVTGLPDFAGGLISRLSAWSASEVFSPVQPPSLLVTEPPDHTRYRKLVTRVFSVKAVNGLKERTQQVASELVDQMDSAGGDPVDLVTRYCGLLPVTVISEILGVPTSERDQILAWGEGAAASLDLGLGWEKFRTVEKALAGFEGWLTDHLERLRREPGDNLLSQLIAAQEDGVGLTERELRATAGLVLAAGFETTVNLLGNGIALLAADRDQLDGLLADPSGWGNAVDEILRFDPPVLLTARLATQETEVAGVRVPAGLMVTTVLAAANRDPDVFTDPDRFDVNRVNARDHVSFSAGRHYCLGAQLARMEGEIGLRTLFERHRDLQLLPGSARRETRILRGYATLPARLS
ncbi:MAG: cytochrome P450 [Nocardioides sp.]